jgi:hypothetical protein
MAELKTKLNNASVDKFLKTVKDEQTRADCYQILGMMQKATKAEPKMWGTSIIGFGNYHYVYESGRESDWFVTGLSPASKISHCTSWVDWMGILTCSVNWANIPLAKDVSTLRSWMMWM